MFGTHTQADMAPQLVFHKGFGPEEGSILCSNSNQSRSHQHLLVEADISRQLQAGIERYSSRRVIGILRKVLQPESSVTAENAALANVKVYTHTTEPFNLNECYFALKSVPKYYSGQPYDADAPLDSKHVRSWISQHAFVALLASFDKFDICLLGLWIMRDAFEESTTAQSADADAAAAQWVTDRGLLYQGEKGTTLQRGSFGRRDLPGWAKMGSNAEAKRLAKSAVRLMGALEETAHVLP
ncbi:hypothetical protein DL770_004507 [Monosporascus sp. CRB-9-2]|nr:hypothetical protein DL770_004507 [Monosporascus sp. CRB-9-2]